MIKLNVPLKAIGIETETACNFSPRPLLRRLPLLSSPSHPLSVPFFP